MNLKVNLVWIFFFVLNIQVSQAGRGNPNCDEGPYCESPKNKENKMHGLEVCKDSKKVTRRTIQYKDGLKNGLWQCFDEKAKLVETRIYANDKLNGKSTKLDEDLNVFTAVTYKDDLKDGEAVTYNTSTSNGKQTITEKVVTYYKDNDFHGWSIVYDVSGKEIKRDCFQNGNLKRDNPELCGAQKKK